MPSALVSTHQGPTQAAFPLACIQNYNPEYRSQEWNESNLQEEQSNSMMVLQEGFFGMLPVSKAKFGTLQKFGMGWSRNLKYAGATCNGLVMKGKNCVIGDALEKQLFHAVEAQYVVSRSWLDLPVACSPHVPAVGDRPSLIYAYITCLSQWSDVQLQGGELSNSAWWRAASVACAQVYSPRMCLMRWCTACHRALICSPSHSSSCFTAHSAQSSLPCWLDTTEEALKT